MTRISCMLVVLLCLGGMATTANIVDIEIGNLQQDSINVGQVHEFLISLENDIVLGGLSLGFTVWSPDGAGFAWNNVGGLDPTNQMFTVPAGCRMDPPGTVWDLGGLQIAEQDLDGVLPDTVLFGGAALSGGLPAGPSQVMAQMSFVTSGLVEGEVKTLCIDSTIVGQSGAFVFVNSVGGAFTPTVAWAEGGRCYPIRPAWQACPEFTSGPVSMNANHCGSNSTTLSATDMESDAIQFGLTENTGNGSALVNDNGDGTCTVTYTPTPADVGSAVSITIFTTDAWHSVDGCNFHTINITVTNNAPQIDCGAAYNIAIDNSLCRKTDIFATDIDACDDLTFNISSGILGDMAINASTGEFSWTPEEFYMGSHTVTIAASDGFQTSECSFVLDVLGIEPFEVRIDKLHDVYQGQYTTLPIRLIKGGEALGGFDFLVHYDQTLLTFSQAELGDYFLNCGWEYFTYRHGWNGNCGTGCPSGEIRLVGIAETNNGPYHPDYACISNASATDETITNLTFFVTADVNANDQFAQVRFFWMDCGDNTISVASGDTLAISRFVYNYFGDNGADSYINITDNSLGFPTQYGAPETCITQFTPEPGKVPPIRFLDLYNGGIDIIDKDDIDDRGDINMNGIANEIADAVMLTNFFIYGESAFNDHVPGSIAASDINADGTPVTVADLVYLTRIIIGDAMPYQKPAPGAILNASFDGSKVYIESNVDAGAALFIFDVNGTVGVPEVNSNLDIVSNEENGELRVLVYNLGTEVITSATELTVPVNGSAELVSVEAATYQGAVLETAIRNLPTTFRAHQNYPNPFNPETTISFDLSVTSEWTVDIYNITGQKVNGFSGIAEPGTIKVVWDSKDAYGSAVASGIYFYKISAGTERVTRQMVLLK